MNRVVPADELAGAVDALAQQIAHNAPLSVRAMKAIVQRVGSQRRRGSRATTWRRCARQVRSSADLQEGLAAQRERRPPRFQGR